MSEEMRVVAEQVIVNPAIPMPQAREDALELAVREHARLVYRIAYSVLRNHHDAEDAAQETFLRVLRYQRRLDGVREPRTWLARIAWRVAVERRRKIPEVTLDKAVDVASGSASAEQILLGSETDRLLEGLIAALPSKLRDPLTLSTLEEMTPADIAGVLGVGEAAVRSRLFRARQVIKQKLAARLEGKHGT
ncbi:MAG TPA: RNA polymerase sigma factor [Terriglobales bacterium]|nr:RNA polymerase sigma factor [Terriglobales bacterium]